MAASPNIQAQNEVVDIEVASEKSTEILTEDSYVGVSLLGTTSNLAKTMIGEGMLSLAASLGTGTGLASGIIIGVSSAGLMAYSFSLVGRVCNATGSQSLRECCEKTGYPRLGKFMTISVFLLLFAACASFSIIIGDSLSDILTTADLTGIWASYKFSLLTVIIAIELPLCLLKDMSKLAMTSKIGVSCEVFVVIFMALRYFDGSYFPGGQYYDTPRPIGTSALNSKNLFKVSSGTSLVLCAFSLAYIGHFQAPKYYHQLRNRSVRRFNLATIGGFSIASLVFLAAMAFGYLTFGHHADGMILNNYSTEDPLATVARVGVLIAVAFGFPLVFTTMRDSVVQGLRLDGQRPETWFGVTLGLLLPILLIGISVRDLGLVNELIGAIFGSLISLIFPGLLLLLTYRKLGGKFCGPAEGKLFAGVLLSCGLVLLVGGTTLTCLEKAGVHL